MGQPPKCTPRVCHTVRAMLNMADPAEMQRDTPQGSLHHAITSEWGPSSHPSCLVSSLWRTHSPEHCQTNQTGPAATSQHLLQGCLPPNTLNHCLHWGQQNSGTRRTGPRFSGYRTQRSASGPRPLPSFLEALAVGCCQGTRFLHLDQI